MRNTYDRYYVHSFNDLDTLPFSAQLYSQMKFGSGAASKILGRELAEGFFHHYAGVLLTNTVVVLPSPYNFVPNAASVMTHHFVNRLNELMVGASGNHVETAIINRKVTYTTDYGFMSKEARADLISNDTFNVNRSYLEGKIVICIDDIRITGVHEDKLREIFEREELNVDRTFFLYYASYKGSSPDVEAALNFAGMKDLDDYLELMKEPGHQLIVRPIKYMLSRDPNVFTAMIDKAPLYWVEELYYACLGEGYYKIPDYQENFSTIRHKLVDKNLILA
jgi:hypothetical protein